MNNKNLKIKFIFGFIIILIILLCNKSMATVAEPNFDVTNWNLWRQQNNLIDLSIGSKDILLSGVEALSSEAASGNQASATELAYKMATLQAWYEKFLLFGYELDGKNGHDKFQYNGSNHAYDVSSKGTKYLYSKIDNNFTNLFVKDDVNLWYKASEVKSWHGAFNCGWWVYIRASLQLGEQYPKAFTPSGVKYPQTYKSASENIRSQFTKISYSKNLTSNSIIYYSGGSTHTEYIEALVLDSNSNGYAYISWAGSCKNWHGISKKKVKNGVVISGSSFGNNTEGVIRLPGSVEITAPVTDSSNTDANLILDVLVNAITAIADAVQSMTTKLMLGITSKEAKVTISDSERELYSNINLVTSDGKEDWWPASLVEGGSSEDTDNENFDMSGDCAVKTEGGNGYYIDASTYNQKYRYINIRYSVEEILSNTIDLLNINFIKPTREGIGLRATLRKVIIYWFRALRYLGLAGLLSVLIYLGIKIMFSTSTSKKADYKKIIVSWVVGILLMFIMPYIMSFVMTMGEYVTNLFGTDPSASVEVFVYDGGGHEGKSTYSKFTTNLLGLVRFQIQNSASSKRLGYAILYVMLVILTIRFTIMYLKRLLNIAYLTMISPIIALMYPIDKTTRGGSQGFNSWLQAYVLDAIIQPVHLLAYYILVTAAMSFAVKNILYVYIVMTFLGKLEDLLRQLLGLPGDSELSGKNSLESNTMGFSSILSTVTGAANLIGNAVSSKNGNSKPRLQDDKNKNSGDVDLNAFDKKNAQDVSDKENNPKDEEKEEKNSEAKDGSGNYKDENKNENKDTEEENSGKQKNNEEEEETEGEHSEEDLIEEDTPEQVESKKDEYSKDAGKLIEAYNNQKQKFKAKISNRESIRELAARKATKIGHKIGYRRGKGLEENAKNIGKKAKKLAKKGAIKGAKTAVALGVGTGAALVQASISVANGKYSPLEAVGTIAGASAITNKFLDKKGKKFKTLQKEFNQTKYGKEAVERKERLENYKNSPETYNEYAKKYASKGIPELTNRLYLGEKIAEKGIDKTYQQTQVMNYMDYMIDKDYRKKYENMSKEEKAEFAKSIAKKDKSLKGMSDEEILKWDMRNNDSKYLDIAVQTMKVKNDILSQAPGVLNKGNESDWKAFVENNAHGNKDIVKGYESARTRIKEMEKAGEYLNNIVDKT